MALSNGLAKAGTPPTRSTPRPRSTSCPAPGSSFKASSALAFASAGAAFVSTLLIFGLMLRRGRLHAVSLLIGGPIYAVYVAAALFLPVGAAGAH